MADELKVTVNRSQAPTRGPALAEAKVANEARAEAMRQQRAAIHEKARREKSEGGSVPTPAAKAEPREDLESVEVQLPNGRTVVFGPPAGVSIYARMIRIKGPVEFSGAEENLLRALLYVRSVDGEPARIANDIDADALANRLGDDGIDTLLAVRAKYFPSVRLSDLPVLKKNVRGP